MVYLFVFVVCCLFFFYFFFFFFYFFIFFFFFFQAEDGIRDRDMTGVQTCALPISLLLQHGVLDMLAHREPVRLVGALRQRLAEPLQDHGARVVGLVDAVSEPHDPLPPFEPAADLLLDVLVASDLGQQVHHLLVGATVQRALEGADGAGDGGVHVGQRGGDHARREGRRVHLVVGVQDQCNVERPRRLLVGPLTGQHPEEVRG